MINIVLIILSILLISILLRPKYQHPSIHRQFVSHETCDYIIQQAKPKLKPSTVSTDTVVDDTIRKSESAWLNVQDSTVKKLIHLMCTTTTDRPPCNCEQLQVVKYTPGGFYNPHQDAFEGEKNMRRYTCILALNDDYEGGETEFPNIKKTYKLNKGDMLFFNTLNDWDMMTPEALHGGKQVISGEKWICNLWIRVFPYSTGAETDRVALR
jgi:hypothetical protein